MKIKQIALLIGSLSLSTLTLAAPVTPADIVAAGSNIDQAWVTGASAPTLTMYEGWVKGCDAGTNAIYSSDSFSNAPVKPGTIKDYNAYACTRGGKVSILYHTIEGGSLNAYTPHTIGTVLARTKFPGTDAACQLKGNYTDPVNPLNDAAVYKGCGKTGSAHTSSLPAEQVAINTPNLQGLTTDSQGPQWPLGGFSDVEASLWSPTVGGGNVASKGVEFDANVGQVFGVVVTEALYRAMQEQQGLTTDDAIENTPNITTEQYASIIAVGGPAALGNGWATILPTHPTSNYKVIVQRRVDTSGTQSSSNAFFLRSPCANAAAASLLPTVTADSDPGVYEVVMQSSSSTLQSQMTTISAAAAGSNYAIGVLSLENDWRGKGYRFLKLDGVHPEADDPTRARKAAASGAYKFHMEMKAFKRNATQTYPLTTFESNILNEIVTDLSMPLAASCSVFPRGLTLNPRNGSDCTAGVEVAKTTNLGNNCQVPIQFIN